MVGLLAPDDPARWPAIDQNDPDYRKDLAVLGSAVEGVTEARR